MFNFGLILLDYSKTVTVLSSYQWKIKSVQLESSPPACIPPPLIRYTKILNPALIWINA